MIKIHNNIPTREDIPSFLQGLKEESLHDLSWTDPNLGVSEFAWYPEIDESLPSSYNQKYDGEVLTVDEENKVVKVVKNIVFLTEEELEAKRIILIENAQSRIEVETSYANRIWQPDRKEKFDEYIAQLALVPQQENYPWEINWPVRPIY
jgi:hypothetical protein